MQINTKFDKRDIVYFFEGGKISRGEVLSFEYTNGKLWYSLDVNIDKDPWYRQILGRNAPGTKTTFEEGELYKDKKGLIDLKIKELEDRIKEFKKLY